MAKFKAAISEITGIAKSGNKKIICFVTGVPGAGKTLVGLEVAAEHLDKNLNPSFDHVAIFDEAQRPGIKSKR